MVVSILNRFMEKMQNVGEMIKQIREERNLSQKRFGRKIGLTGKSISAYETGRCSPPLKVLENISNVYDVSLFKFIQNKQLIKGFISEIEKVFIKELTF